MADSVHQFIVSLEAKAKRILKDADKKRRDDARAEHVKQFVNTKPSKGSQSKKLPQTGTILMPLVDTSNMGSSGKLPSGHLGNEKITSLTAQADMLNNTRNAKTQQMQYSVPKLSVSLEADTINLDELASSGKVGISTRPLSGPGRTTLRPLDKTTRGGLGSSTITQQQGGETLSMSSSMNSIGSLGGKKTKPLFDKSFLKDTVQKTTKANKTLSKLDQSPLMNTFSSEKPDNLNEYLESKKKNTGKKENKILMESTWSLKTHATDVLSGKMQGNTNAIQTKQAKNAAVKKKGSAASRAQEEPQGPIDWNIRGLRSKYRGEVERENLYQNWLMANKYADVAVDDGGLILSVSKIERHPLYVLYNRVLEEENIKSFRRTRTRLRMKRFVLDVQELWLSNLQHLREHQPAVFLQEQPEELPSDKGLQGRRDSAAIKGLESQIPSVSDNRALQHAFYSSTMDPPDVILDYEPGPCPTLRASKSLPPVLENIIDGLSVTPTGNSTDQQNTHLLFIDRMLPTSTDTDREIAWRISVMEKKNVTTASFYTNETTVLDFVRQSTISIDHDDPPVTAYICDTMVKWSVMDVPAKFKVYLSYSHDNFKKILVKIIATLGPEFDSNQLEIHTNVAELLSLYPRYCEGVNTLSNISWWSSTTATSIWENVIDSIQIKEDEFNDEGDPFPKSLIFNRKKNVASRVQEAIETPHAFSIAFDLTKFISINSFKVNPTDIQSVLKISVNSPDSSIKTMNNKYGDTTFEEIADNIPCLSYRVQGAIQKASEVPGSSEYWYSDEVDDPSKPPYMQDKESYHTHMGLWFAYPFDKERTRPSTHYFRDPELSTTNSILMVTSLALDTPILLPTTTAWEAFTEMPAKCPGETADGVIPLLYSTPKNLLIEPLHSPLTERMSFMTAIFSTIPIEGMDHVPIDSPTLPDGFQRHWPERNKYGFRRKVINHLLGVDQILPTIVFGITRSGAIPNYTGVTTRNIWHNILAVVENINRPRTAKDYQYVLSSGNGRGANNPNAFSIIFKEGVFHDLFCQFFAKYEEEYAEIAERKAIFARMAALDQKIELSEIALRTREKMLEKQILKEKQKAIEKKLRKANKSEKGWRRRMRMSVLVEVQKNWEKRKDYYSGAYFWHEILPTRYDADQIDQLSVADDRDEENEHELSTLGQHTLGGGTVLQASPKNLSSKVLKRKKKDVEQYLQTCQWNVPATWDGDPLSDNSQAPSYHRNLPAQGTNMYGDDGSKSGISMTGDSEVGYIPPDAFDGTQAFEEPKDTWVPGGDFSILDGGKTPGTRSANILPRPVKETDRRDLMSYGNGNENNKRGLEYMHKDGRGGLQTNMSLHAENSANSVSEATINTKNMEIIAEQIVKSDEMIKILAKRLGIPLNNLVGVDEMQSVFSDGGDSSKIDNNHYIDANTKELHTLKPGDALPAPRDAYEDDVEDPEFDSDEDLWSDDEDEAGDHDIDDNIGDLPQGHQDVLQLKLQQIRQAKAEKGSVKTTPSNIPYLNLKEKLPSMSHQENQSGNAWRRLARPDIKTTFHAKLLLRRTIGPDEKTSNQPNNCIYLLPISPVDACEYDPPNFETHIESIFIPDAKKDMERAVATLERNIKREEELAKNIPTDDLILFGQAKESTSQDMLIAQQYKQDQDAFKDPTEAAIEKAIQAAKASNITQMEDALEEEIPVNCSDEHGNTILILAAQQGSKRMCKFLLRRGADINAQNLAGNTVLHFCYTYSHAQLAEYLISRGADDSILNVDGMTCYEGLNSEALEDPYGEGF